jgi:hypothetical protein
MNLGLYARFHILFSFLFWDYSCIYSFTSTSSPMLSINILRRHVNDHGIHNAHAHSIQHKQIGLTAVKLHSTSLRRDILLHTLTRLEGLSTSTLPSFSSIPLASGMIDD